MNAIKQRERRVRCGRSAVPDTPLITSAIKYARENSEPYLFNHAMRSWLFAVSLAQLKQARMHDGRGSGGDDHSPRHRAGGSVQRAVAI